MQDAERHGRRAREPLRARTEPIERDPAWYEDRARGLVSAHRAGVPGAYAQIRDWHPRFRNAADGAIAAGAFTLDDARLVYARQHGSPDWATFTARIERLAAGRARVPFLLAFEALRARDIDVLRDLLERHPDLAQRRGTNGNTLLNLACGFASTDTVRLLLDAGADVDAANDRGWTPLHQAGTPELADLLVHAGAALDREAHGAGGTPLAAALFWGNPELADALAAHGVVPLNLRVAAGLGRADLVESMVDAGGRLLPPAFQARGFYRPHSGFPLWRPSDDPQEVLDEALTWASRSGRVEVLPRLVELGADVDADPYRGTPLIWAACKGRLEAAAWLLDHGADVDRRATFGGPTHGEGVTALHLAAQRGDVATVRLLVERGADATIEDAIHHGSPRAWAEHFGQDGVLRLLDGR